MADDDAIYSDPIVTRKLNVDWYVATRKVDADWDEVRKCHICSRDFRRAFQPRSEFHPFTCRSCCENWGATSSWPRGTSRADRAALQTLSAYTNALFWEVKNGQGRWRRAAV